MARGWESKAIEDQQSQMADSTRRPPGRELTPDERARADRQQSLALARARAVAGLTAATREPHRRLLEATIAAIDAEMQGLGDS
jgi:hypothetical protein